MNYSQLKPFNQAQGGTTPNLCLDNVRRGFGIDNKYASAWEAWLNTQQHPDRNIPDGLDVPLFYSYTATIDGVTANYGHINVRLANGTVWSDGNIYASIDAYLANHSPKYVGWGESVNDIKLIEGTTEMITTANDLKYLYLGVYAQDTPDALLATDGFVGQDFGLVTEKVLDYANKSGFAYWQYKASAEKEISDLKTQLAKLTTLAPPEQSQVLSPQTIPAPAAAPQAQPVVTDISLPAPDLNTPTRPSFVPPTVVSTSPSNSWLSVSINKITRGLKWLTK